MPQITETFFARDRDAWRAWLDKNHAAKKEIWLQFFKKHTGKHCVSYDEAVEEALCFGWIDGILKRIDDEKYVQRFSPRNPKSIWSESNKARVKKMIAAGRMTEAGLALVKAGKKSGQWAKADWRSRSDAPPAGMLEELSENTKAREFFETLAPSYKKMYVAWVLDAKRHETRKRRIEVLIDRLSKGKRPGIDM